MTVTNTVAVTKTMTCVVQVLRNYGPKGRSVGKIVEEMSKKGLRDFSSARNAKSSVASTCAHDTAFARVAPGTFALRAVPGVVEVWHFPLTTVNENGDLTSAFNS